MKKPQIFTTPSGDEFVILPRADYEDLLARAERPRPSKARAPDNQNERTEAEAPPAPSSPAAGADIRRGLETVFPPDVAAAIAGGANPIRAIREWRGVGAEQLAEAVGIDVDYVTGIEEGARRGSTKVLRAIANELDVPLVVLTDPHLLD